MKQRIRSNFCHFPLKIPGLCNYSLEKNQFGLLTPQKTCIVLVIVAKSDEIGKIATLISCEISRDFAYGHHKELRPGELDLISAMSHLVKHSLPVFLATKLVLWQDACLAPSLPASPLAPCLAPSPLAPCLAPSLPALPPHSLPCPLAPCLAPSLPASPPRSLPHPLTPLKKKLDLDVTFSKVK